MFDKKLIKEIDDAVSLGFVIKPFSKPRKKLFIPFLQLFLQF